MLAWLWTILIIAGIWTLSYLRASLIVWSIAVAAFLLLFSAFSGLGTVPLCIIWGLFIIAAGVLNFRPLRRQLITKRILNNYRQALPKVSATEQEALGAGTVGWEGDLFAGKPDWPALFALPKAELSEEEQAFLDGPVTQLCDMIDDWQITHQLADLPDNIWRFLKNEGFFALIIPRKYGGKEFSAYAHGQILQRIASLSSTVASIVAVPNSLGPAELLVLYGTDAQKNHYLPRLACGDEIPCFALTGPEAGSDASAIPDVGIVSRGEFEGKEIIGMRLTWDKRYITLAPIATVLGLAFHLYDPENLLGQKKDIGITCALIPVNTPGVIIGRRHLPLNNPFQNGPTKGQDVFVPLDYIIGGAKLAGQGWRMLVNCLAVGRSISLPSNTTGVAKGAAFASGAYARVRRQFNQPIGYFEGVEEVLGRIAGMTYMMSALCDLTITLVDQGQKPAILSAISKYHCTELARKIACDAMDIHGGKGICLGPKNYLGRGYQAAPISITVEGANILSRSLIIFGQGVVRCHPYIFKEHQAAQNRDKKQSLKDFDYAFFSHIGFSLSNISRSLWLGLSSARLVQVPPEVQVLSRYIQLLTRYSAAFAFLADISVLIMGSQIKRKERISARLGDIFSFLYIGAALLKRFYDEGMQAADQPLLQWSIRAIFMQIQTSFIEILQNFPKRFMAKIMRWIIFPLGKRTYVSDDKLDHLLAQLLLQSGTDRDRLISGIYQSNDKNKPFGLLAKAQACVIAAQPLQKRLDLAIHKGEIDGMSMSSIEKIEMARTKGLFSKEEAQLLLQAETLRQQVIAVDDFSTEELRINLSPDVHKTIQEKEQTPA